VDDSGKEVGMITGRDIAIAVATQGRPALEIAASGVISGEVKTFIVPPADRIWSHCAAT
jgi:hypothetical protein